MKLTRFFVYSLLFALLAGCSAEKNGPVSRAFHNLNARFNGYFLAREKMLEVETKLAAATVNDYNRILDVLPPLDTTVLKTLQPDLDEVIKRASFPIARHPKSRWVDDCYVLIGKARYYQGEEAEAIKTFRYVQTTSKDRHAKHAALVWLMRTYLRAKDYDNATSVSELFRKERMNEDNGRELLLTRAQLASEQNNLPIMIENLERALPFVEARDEESRVRFILGQAYQATNQDAKAYEQFAKVLKKNPPYELGFYSKLSQAQVTELKDVTEQDKVESFLNNLAKDEKNKEYLDKIYYDLAKLELRQQQYPAALEYLAKSTKASTRNRTQKAYSYLLAGQIHYEHLQEYKLAQAYYDSTLQLLPPTTLGYDELADRRTVLTAFTQQLEIIRTEDSLQALAQLPAAERTQRIAQQIEQEQQAKAEATTAATNRPSFTSAGPAPAGGSGGTWYFDNPVAMASARNDFLRVWGERPLQDNWRRATALSMAGGQLPDATAGAGVDSTALAAANAQKQEAYAQAIPLTLEQKQASDKKIEEALFTLGNIYQQRLREPEQAAKTFQQLLQRFPASAHASEAYYSLYVLAQSQKQATQAAQYAQALKERFPNSKYSRLIDQPDFLTQFTAENAAAHALYDSAYQMYDREEYALASAVLGEISQKYPGNDIPDQVAFLAALITSRTHSPSDFKAALEGFQKQFQDSPLQARAAELLAVQQRLENEQVAKPELPAAAPPVAPAAEAPAYKVDLAAPHAFVLAYPNDSLAAKTMVTALQAYATRYHAKKNLTVQVVALTDSARLIVVQPFSDYKASDQFSRLQKARNSPLVTVKGPKFATFVISAENLLLLQQLKDLPAYLAFFEKNYQ
ncbi:tetratricopeptide repeat protein [Nibribacter ruber]|uniref:Tetratricopeptide repeat protein n=1 Tax=Nibribacter ruber TaxID=2698458 RepID=A0A6P1NVK9_9BACT|nr:tetratricopeptide repeat protein [Nibribacter ruber]QHL87876.1 tetratricopeptide repeat protein [Nibribacter ruber]